MYIHVLSLDCQHDGKEMGKKIIIFKVATGFVWSRFFCNVTHPLLRAFTDPVLCISQRLTPKKSTICKSNCSNLTEALTCHVKCLIPEDQPLF